MSSAEIRKKFLNFFAEKGHTVVASSSLIPDDPSVLLTTAGMQQFKKYYTEPSLAPAKNIASIQKCFRTSDIDEVGDESHLTFFEMLGNFSFGGYFKKEAIQYGYDFLKETGLPIEYVSVFGGDREIPADEESEKIWKGLEVAGIEKRGREENFWGPTGSEGPCGPTTEIYCGGAEIWNIVFNEYYCAPDKTFKKLAKPGVDTGMGLERLAAAQNKKNIFETDLFAPILALLPSELPGRKKRIIADHLRGSVFLIADGVRPSNKEAGYVLRRLLRRTMAYESVHKIPPGVFAAILKRVAGDYSDFYPELRRSAEIITEEFEKERGRFGKTLVRGIKELERMREKTEISGATAFNLYETFGLPYEIIKEFGGEKARNLDRESFEEEFRKHQEISRAGQEKKFGGHGLLLDTGEIKAAGEAEVKIVTRLHTATHLLHSALRRILGPEARQKGSDITPERTRFDFAYPRKLAPEEIRKIEELVNEAVKKDLLVEFEELPYEEAVKKGALHFFREKYPPVVRVYSIRDSKTGEVFSREICGGPHVSRTAEIGRFKILKEESSSAGVRRLRAVLTE